MVEAYASTIFFFHHNFFILNAETTIDGVSG